VLASAAGRGSSEASSTRYPTRNDAARSSCAHICTRTPAGVHGIGRRYRTSTALTNSPVSNANTPTRVASSNSSAVRASSSSVTTQAWLTWP